MGSNIDNFTDNPPEHVTGITLEIKAGIELAGK